MRSWLSTSAVIGTGTNAPSPSVSQRSAVVAAMCLTRLDFPAPG
ncbi:hypothetical protein [Allokutzneria sp. A3M-2-11 16]|nr:hypothetical protein [Allokutzneria sp. A3M-2-11 16]